MPKGQGKRIACPDCDGQGWRYVQRGRIVPLSTIGRVLLRKKNLTYTKNNPETCKTCNGKGWMVDNS